MQNKPSYLNFSLLTPQRQFFPHPYTAVKAAALCVISGRYICPPGERREKGLLQIRFAAAPLALVEVCTIENNRRMQFSSCCQILRSYLFPLCRFSASPISRSAWSAINRGIFSTSPSSFKLSRENRTRSFT